MTLWSCYICGATATVDDLATCPKTYCSRCETERPVMEDEYDPADDGLPGFGG